MSYFTELSVNGVGAALVYFIHIQTKKLAEYIKQIEDESIVAIAVQDSGGGIAFDKEDAEVMESLGAGTDDCPVHIGRLFNIVNYSTISVIKCKIFFVLHKQHSTIIDFHAYVV